MVVRTREEDELKKWSVVYPLADVKCRKDTGKIFKSTVHKNLAAGVNKIVHSNIKFEQIEVDEVTTWKCSLIKKDATGLDSTSDLIREVEVFLVRDLKFLSVMLGMETFDGNWCYLCQLYIAEWKRHYHKHLDGIRWTLQKVVDQAGKCSNLEGKARIGMRECPYFDIPVARYI